MLMYQLIQKKKVLIYSSYSIFLFLGFLSLWRTMSGYSLNELSSLLAPVFYAFLVVFGILLLLRPIFFASLYTLVNGSVLLLITIFIDLSGWAWTEEVIFAHTLLVAITGTISIFIITQGKAVVQGVGISILFSTMFFILLHMTQLFPALYSNLILLLIVGQGAAYLFSILLLPWIEYFLGKDTYVKRKTQILKRNTKEKDEHKSILLRVLYIAYILIVVLSWYYVYLSMSALAWTMIGAFCLLLLAALFNSFKSALIMKSLILSIGIVLAASLIVTPAAIEKDLVIGVLLLLGIGLHPLLIRVLTPHTTSSIYLLVLACFIAALLPFGMSSLENLEWVTNTILLGYLLVHILGLIYFPLFKEPFIVSKRRSSRPISSLISGLAPVSVDEKERINDSNISIEVRERDLAILYGSWLRERERRTLQDFSKNND